MMEEALFLGGRLILATRNGHARNQHVVHSDSCATECCKSASAVRVADDPLGACSRIQRPFGVAGGTSGKIVVQLAGDPAGKAVTRTRATSRQLIGRSGESPVSRGELIKIIWRFC